MAWLRAATSACTDTSGDWSRCARSADSQACHAWAVGSCTHTQRLCSSIVWNGLFDTTQTGCVRTYLPIQPFSHPNTIDQG